MSQSLVNIPVHLTFSTQGRERALRDAERDRLHAYMGGILKEHGSPLIEINSVADHVHILFALSKTLDVSKLVEHLKSHSSSWIKELHPAYKGFYWQRGYGAFAVSPTHVERVREYIRRQPEHHARLTFQDEFRRLCRKNHVALDERYAWD